MIKPSEWLRALVVGLLAGYAAEYLIGLSTNQAGAVCALIFAVTAWLLAMRRWERELAKDRPDPR